MLAENLRTLNETLERRVAERTAVAENRARQLQALAAELTQAEQAERRRIARLLHDELQQLLVAAQFKLRAIQRQLQQPGQVQAIGDVKELLDQIINQSRSPTAELSPPVWYDRGLIGGLEWLARQMREPHDLPVEVAPTPRRSRRGKTQRVFLFQAARELLRNVVKHAQAGSARIDLNRQNQHLYLVVSDDGVGFNPAECWRSGAPAAVLGCSASASGSTCWAGNCRSNRCLDGGLRVTVSVSA